MAEQFRHIKCTQLISDVFTSVGDFDWRHMVPDRFSSKKWDQVLWQAISLLPVGDWL
ncbi:MAG TPA: hypothetical protein VLI39_22115 [Sedimentisphaerales bacterium]|nr:hypothetical protein [Sedimentisphaerales bacterium]